MNRVRKSPAVVSAEVNRQPDRSIDQTPSPAPAVPEPQLRLLSARPSERGVALVITVIMLSVITFMAVAFLVLSQREKGASTTSTHQTIATLAAEMALDRAKADLIAPMLAFQNPYGYGLRVSTNYANGLGFDRSQPLLQLSPDTRSWATNVSFIYPDGKPVTPGSEEFVQVVANLFYDPRAPVFITNRLFASSNDFRFYLDLNRNGRYDTNGLIPVISPDGKFYDATSDAEIPPTFPWPNNALRRPFVGDPEWIGVLERPDQPHSSTNRFVSRFAYVAVPAGKTLDLNAIGNQAKLLNPQVDGFLRNMGVSSFELNLAAFLADLNTNLWNRGNSAGFEPIPPYPATLAYSYRTNLNQPSQGTAFTNATEMIRYRYNQTYNSLRSVNTLFGPTIGGLAFQTDGIDGYANGPLMTTTALPDTTTDNDVARVSFPWSGSETPNHFFTTQDLLDATKTSLDFSNRLASAGSKENSYDRYTFYRLLSQLGTDSDPEPSGKMNLNYDNLVQRNAAGIVSATNFYPWTAAAFFTNAADRLLQRFTADWLATTNLFEYQWYTNTFVTTKPFGITNVPVRVGSNFVYTASIHRLLQLAANVWEATQDPTNRMDQGFQYPTVFKPIFQRVGPDVFITGYFEVSNNAQIYLTKPKDLRNPADVATLQPYDNVFGVPWIIGAKKGLPNFNEFAFQSVFQITRKLQITRDRLDADPSTFRTNQMYLLSISNVLAAETWNSYARSNYTRPVQIWVTNYMDLALTNSDGLRLQWPLAGNPSYPVMGFSNVAIWPAQAFVVPLRAAINFPVPSMYRQATHMLTNRLELPFETGQGFPFPQWGAAVTNRLQFIMRDPATGRIIDYVQMAGLDNVRDLNSEIMTFVDGTPGWGSLWDTNRQGGGTSVTAPTRGIVYQVNIALGEYGANKVDWTSYGLAVPSKLEAIDNFRRFFDLAPLYNQDIADNTNLVQEVPFTPSLKLSRYSTWQANDPLVHYTPADLRYLLATNELRKESKPSVTVQTVENIGRLNNRYQPWGGSSVQSQDPDKYNLTLKDPLVMSSDDWDFPTNRLPNIGWLGRVHRGTPWQTLYLKSGPVKSGNQNLRPANAWQLWSGNPDAYDALRTQPATDRLIFDLFTTAFGDTASRGQLSINQSGVAAWSAVFSGVLAVTNTLSDSQVQGLQYEIPRQPPTYRPIVVQPAGDDPLSPLATLVNDINHARATNRSGMGVFTNLGDVLSAPALTVESPFLNRSSSIQLVGGLTDAAYERLPQQVLGLLKVGQPRFVIYGYGQTLIPVVNSVVSGGPYAGLCTNYQITAETALRAVVRLEGAPSQPRVVVESYSALPPD